MATDITPTKTLNFDCCFCLSSNINIKFNLVGKKCNNYDFRSKLKSVFGLDSVDLIDDLFESNASVCRNCFSSFSRFYEFISASRFCFEEFILRNGKKKRMANFSPPTMPMGRSSGTDISISRNPDVTDIESTAVPTDYTPSPKERIRTTSLASEIVAHGHFYPEHSYSRHAYPSKNNQSHLRGCTTETHADHGYNRVPARKELFPTNSEDIFSSFKAKYRLVARTDGPNNTSINTDQVKEKLVEIVHEELKKVSTKRVGEESILLSKKSMKNLADDTSQLCRLILDEMKNRTPVFLDVIIACFDDHHMAEANRPRLVGAIAAIYSIIMFNRNPELSAFQRMVTSLCIRGRAEDMLITRLNRIGFTLSTSSKQRLIKEAGEISQNLLTEYLEDNPLLKITGDNLDVYIKTRCKTVDKSNSDLHLFASNAISTRLASPDMDEITPVLQEQLCSKVLLLTAAERDNIKYSYSILIARILSTMDQFKWMTTVTPSHIHHCHSAEMTQKSKVFQLPIEHKNEAKYEEVLDIMDGYERFLQKNFQDAHGTVDALDKYGVVAGGDQLTKVRFEGAKNLRILSRTSTGRLEHLRPIICELWHLKQDYLEKTFKALYDVKSMESIGTLSYWRNKLKKTDVSGKVKGHFNTHSEFLKLITAQLIKEQATELFDLNINNPSPYPPNIHRKSKQAREEAMKKLTSDMIEAFYFNLEDGIHNDCEDELFNYCTNLAMRGLHYINMEDTVKEGDTSRIVPNLKMCIPIFYAHSCLSKYMFECVDYVMKVDYLLSPLDRLRVLEGSFINMRGGAGNNVEADLIQEHFVRNQKDLIKGLGANKTKTAISSVTAAAPIISKICEQFDNEHCIPKKSSRHSKSISGEDCKVLSDGLRDIRPYRILQGRKCGSFGGLPAHPCSKVDFVKMALDLDRCIERIRRGYPMGDIEEEDDGESDNDSDDENDIPEIPL